MIVVVGALLLPSGFSGTSLEVAPDSGQSGKPSVADHVLIRSDTTYKVPEGKALVLTALGTGCLDDREGVGLKIEGKWVSAVRTQRNENYASNQVASLMELPTGIIAHSGETVEVTDVKGDFTDRRELGYGLGIALGYLVRN
jgi:hypothetical protein